MRGREGARYKKSGSKGGEAVAFSWNLADFLEFFRLSGVNFHFDGLCGGSIDHVVWESFCMPVSDGITVVLRGG